MSLHQVKGHDPIHQSQRTHPYSPRSKDISKVKGHILIKGHIHNTSIFMMMASEQIGGCVQIGGRVQIGDWRVCANWRACAD